MRRRAPKPNFLEKLASGAASSRKSDSSKIHTSSNCSLLPTLIEVAALCKRNKAEKLFAHLVLSIPIADSRCKSISNKPKIRSTKIRHEVFKITNDRTKHRNTSAKQKSTHKNKNFNKTNSTFKCQGISSSIKKGNFKNKHTSNLTKQKCILCLKERARINGYNATCLQCNYDFNDASGLNKHMIKNHNVHEIFDLKKLLINTQKSNYVNVFDNKKTVSNAGSTERSREFVSTQEENVTTQRNLNKQEHNNMLMNNQVARIERQGTDNISKVYRFCKQCKKYVGAPLFHSHTAAHQKERDRYERQLENSELSQNFQAPYEQVEYCADPADRQAFVDIPADGNCFFSSIIKLLDLSITPSQIRKQLLASPLVNSCLNPDGVRSILSSETDYAEMDCIYIFSKVYDKNVCIHYRYVNTATQMEEVQYCHFRVNSSQSFLHLHLQHDHYTPLIEM